MASASSSDARPARNGRGWSVVIAALTINLVLGVLYAWGVMAKALTTQWHWTKTQAALPFTVSTGAFAITMVFAGRLQDKMGPRRIAALGGAVLGGGLLLSAYADSPSIMVLTFGVIGGIGIGLGYSATTPPAIKWFPPDRKGVITGIVVSGVGLAAVYIAPLTQYLLKETTIPNTFAALGAGAIVTVLVLAQGLVDPPAGYQPAPSGSSAERKSAALAASGRRTYDWHEMLRTTTFYQLWCMMILAASAGLMLIAHIAIIAKEQAQLGWGAAPVALLAIFNTTGRVVSGFVSDRIGRTRTMVLAFGLQALNMFVFANYTTPELLVFGSAFTGLCYGAIFTLMPAAIADFYGLRHLGVNYGLLFTGFGVAGIVGPILGGQIRDHFGTYRPSYTIAAVMLLIGVVLALRTRAPNAAATPGLDAAEKA